MSVLLALVLVAAGWSLTPRRPRPVLVALALFFAAGVVVFHALLALSSFCGLRWQIHLLAALLMIAPLARLLRSPDVVTGAPGMPKWADVASGAVLSWLAYLGWKLRNVTSDYTYDWGVKGEKFFLQRGIDFRFLNQPWTIHPSYPTAVPELYAASALLHRSFEAPEMMLWSALAVALAWAVYRDLVSEQRHGALLALGIAGAIAAACLQCFLFGGAEPFLFLSIALAARGMLVEDADSDFLVCVAAALAGAVKIEGLVLGALILATHGLRRLPRLRQKRATWARVLMLGAPYAAMAVLEVLLLRRVGGEPAFSPGLSGLSRLVGIPGLVLRECLRSHLGGLAFLPLAAPLLVCFRRTRSIGVVASLQIAFYLLVYAVAPANPDDYIRTSFARIASPFVPLVLASVMLLLQSRGDETRARTASRF